MNVLLTGAHGFIGRYLLAAVAASRPLPPAYRRCVAIWFALGWPAFGAFLVIFWLMVAKPDPW